MSQETHGDKKVKDYLKEIHAAAQKNKPDDRTQALRFLAAKMKFRRGKIPEGIDYDLARKIFWDYYLYLVNLETSIDFDNITMDKSTSVIVKNLVLWLIGSKKGDYDPARSLYIWGDLGVGKSTVVNVGHHMMNYFKHRYQWQDRYFKIASLDQVFLQTYTTQSLSAIGKLGSDFMCLDELKERHMKYKHYGNDLFIINDILSARHSIWKHESKQTIITSNIPPEDLKKLLDDDRLHDHMKQQYILIHFEGVNKRHPKHRL